MLENTMKRIVNPVERIDCHVGVIELDPYGGFPLWAFHLIDKICLNVSSTPVI